MNTPFSKRPRTMYCTQVLIYTFLLVLTTLLTNGQRTSYSSIKRNDTYTYKISTGATNYEVKIKGEVNVTPDDRDIKAITPGGFISIEKTTFGNDRKVVIEADESGNLIKNYYENSKKAAYEPKGRAWLSDVLLDVIRDVGLDANGRVPRIYAKGGADAVIKEIEAIENSSGKGRYFEVLLVQPKLTEANLKTVVEEIGEDISSNSTRGELLRKYSDKFLSSSTVSPSYFTSVAKLSSNSERGNVLRHIIRQHKLNDKDQIQLLRVTSDLSSNAERSAVLRRFSEVYTFSPAVTTAYLEVVEGMSSSSERGAVLRSLLEKGRVNNSELIKLLNITKEIPGSSEKAAVLRAAIPHVNENEAAYSAFLNAVSSISSSTEQGTVLVQALDRKEIDNKSAAGLFKVTERNPSSSEKGRILQKGAFLIDRGGEVSEAYLNAVKSISSSSEKGEVLRTAAQQTTTPGIIILLIKTAETIPSSTEKADVLLAVSKHLKENEQVRSAYKEAASTISSSYDYRRVMEKL